MMPDGRSNSSSRSTESLVALAVHDLREPIQALRAFLSILLDDRAGPINDVQRDFLETTIRTTSRMERLVEDIQIITRYGSQIPLRYQKTHLLDRIAECCAELSPLANNLGMRFSISHYGSANFEFCADPDRIDQILLNVLENALRHGTPQTSVVVRARASRSRILCTIRNDYRISNDEDSRYDPDAGFIEPVDNAWKERRHEGLGISSARYLVSAHGGYLISRISNTTFTCAIVLPRRRHAVNPVD